MDSTSFLLGMLFWSVLGVVLGMLNGRQHHEWPKQEMRRCPKGHPYFYGHDECPVCSERNGHA